MAIKERYADAMSQAPTALSTAKGRPRAVQLCALSDSLEHELATRYGAFALHRLAPDARRDWLAANAAGIEIAVTSGKDGCDNATLEALTDLRLLAIYGVGHDQIDLAATHRRGIAVTNTPGALTDDVADLAVGLVISLLRRLPAADHHVRSGAWEKTDMPLARRVSGKRFGIIGLGRIGEAIALRLAAFGPVAYTSRERKLVPWDHLPDEASLAAVSDVLIVACAANAATRGMVDRTVLDALGPEGYLINIARGSVVDETALVAALESRRLAGAALDVFAEEPHVPAALRMAENTVLAPHIGSATHETRAAMARAVLANIDAFLAGAELPGLVTPG